MGIITAALATAAVAAPAIVAIETRKQNKKAEKENKRAARIEARKAAVRNARERRKAVAQSLIGQAQVQARTAGQGFTSTGNQAQVNAIGQQTASNISFQSSMERMTSRQQSFLQDAQRADRRAQEAQMYGKIPGQLGVPTPVELASMFFSQGQ